MLSTVNSRLRRILAWTVSAGLVAGLGASAVPRHDGTAPDPSVPTADSGSSAPSAPAFPPATWSRPLEDVFKTVGLAGNVLVVPAGRTLLGLRRGDGGELWRLDYPEDSRYTIAGEFIVVRHAPTRVLGCDLL
jgi:hypothetical protein